MRPDISCSLIFPYIRFFNASPHGGAVDFYLGSTLVAAGIKYLSFTPYIKTGTGMQCVKFTRSGRKDEVCEKLCFNQNPGEVKLIAVAGKADNAHFFTIDESVKKENRSFGNIRFCKLCPDDDGIDVYINNIHKVADMHFQETSKYFPVQNGSCDVKIACGDKIIIPSENIRFKKGEYLTCFITGLKNEYPRINKVISTDAPSYNGFYL